MDNWTEIKHQLERPFPVSKLHWRVGATTKDKSKGIALVYVDARDVMKRLDDVMGPYWQCRYPISDNGLLVCEIGLKLGDEWMWRSNGAGDTQVEAEKGKASDAFKRAAVLWGVSRYLYALSNIWTPIKPMGRSHVLTETPDVPEWATPEGYDKLMEKRK